MVEKWKRSGSMGVGGMLLARVPNEIAEARPKYYAEKAKDADDAVKTDLLRDQHPSMPITVDRHSTQTFGGNKK